MSKARRLFRDLPLGSKLAGLSSLLVLAVVLVLTLFSMRRERESFRQELESQATLMLETLPLTIRDQLYQLQIDELQDVANVVGDNERVTLLKIYGSEGALLVDAERDEPVFGRVAEPLGESLIRLGDKEIVLNWESDQLVAGRSIRLGNQVIGAVAIGLSTEPLDAKVRELTRQAALIGVSALIVGIGLMILLAREITTPLSELTEIAGEMAGGDREKRVQLEASDEIGQLGSAFNAMADSIKQREDDLKQFAAGLELTVAERTGELREKVEELEKANRALDIARKQAEEATEIKSQFLATMSHELRTPLNAVLGFSQLLMAGTSGDLTEKQMDKVKRIFRNGQTLLEMINDLLDLAKIEAGRLELLEEPFVVKDWLTGISTQFDGLAKDKGLTVTYNLDNDLPEKILADRVRLQQIVVNLLSNAIKFTDEGSVTVDVARLNKKEWTISVSDTGIGIPAHAQEYIFDEFRQVDGTSQRRHGGTGLGLAIVKNLVLTMGGTVRVKSAVGEGSTFSIRLPLTEKPIGDETSKSG